MRTSETISYQYDALDRQTLIDLPSGSSNDVYMGYDLLGDLLYAHYGSAGGSGVDYAYDAFNRTTSETSYGRAVASQYDAAGNRTRLTYPDGNYIQYTYDILNRMLQVKQNGSTVLAQYSYDSLDRETGITRSNSTTTSMSYGSSSTSWSLSQGGMSQNVTFSLSYTPAGQVYQRTISNSAYAYSAPSLSNSYSSNGLNQYSSVSGSGYSYDGRGNLTSNSSRGLNYDLQNRLTSNSSVSPAVSLAYDPVGRLYQETVVSTTEQFLYDGSNLIAEYDSSGNCLRRYVPGRNVDETLVWYEGSGLSTPNWLHTDQQGSVVATTNASGTATTYTYSPTGEPTSWTGPRFRYTGQAAIPELALYYYKARFYDPALGRFLQTDPAGYMDDLNLYTYAGNNSPNVTDPSGWDECPPICESITVIGQGLPGVTIGDINMGDIYSNLQEWSRRFLSSQAALLGSNARNATSGTNGTSPACLKVESELSLGFQLGAQFGVGKYVDASVLLDATSRRSVHGSQGASDTITRGAQIGATIFGLISPHASITSVADATNIPQGTPQFSPYRSDYGLDVGPEFSTLNFGVQAIAGVRVALKVNSAQACARAIDSFILK